MISFIKPNKESEGSQQLNNTIYCFNCETSIIGNMKDVLSINAAGRKKTLPPCGRSPPYENLAYSSVERYDGVRVILLQRANIAGCW